MPKHLLPNSDEADLQGMVRRLAARLNRGGLVGKTPEEFIRMMGGRHVACMSERNDAHLYTFGPNHDSVVLIEVDGHFVTGRDAASQLSQSEQKER